MKRAALFTAIILVAVLLVGCAEKVRMREEQPRIESLPETEYHITAELLPKEHLLALTTEIDYSAPIDGISSVKFRLYPNAYEEGHPVVPEDRLAAAYPRGILSYGNAEILSISSDIPITDSDIGQNDLLLTVRLARELERGERVHFSIIERVTLANVKHRLGYYGGYYYLSNFYPEVCPFVGGKYVSYDYTPYGDPFRFDNASFSLDLTLPTGYVCASGAEELHRETQGGKTIYSFAAKGTREIAVVTSQKMRCLSCEDSGRKLSYYYEVGTNRDKILSFIADAIAYYEEQFGAYPYVGYSVVVAPFFESGVEHSGMSVLSSDLSFAHLKKAILHETAHQWWFGKVGNDEYMTAWLDEGLAEYSVAAYYTAKGFTAITREMIGDAEDAYAIRLALKGSDGVRFDLPLSEMSEGYYDRVYAGGFLLFFALSERYGIERFHSALHCFADRCHGCVATADDLILSLTDSLGEDPSSLLRAWLRGTVPIQ